MNSTLVKSELDDKVGLDSFIKSSRETSRPILGHNKCAKNITKEEIERIRNEFSTETELLPSAV